jgi:hypothetical protein
MFLRSVREKSSQLIAKSEDIQLIIKLSKDKDQKHPIYYNNQKDLKSKTHQDQ